MQRQQSTVSMSSVKLENSPAVKQKRGQLSIGKAMGVYWKYGGIILGVVTFVVRALAWA
jgi:hypothetical protein